jgi:uncharacterized membrane protein
VKKVSNIKIETIFLVFCLIFGSLFAIINPPFAASDESWHFLKAYDISQGHLIPKSFNIGIPKSFNNIYCFDAFGKSTIENYKNRDYNKFNVPLNYNDTQRIDNIPSLGFMPLPYLATAFIIKIGELFNTSPLILMYFSRLLNLLIYCVIVYFGIKITPIGNYIFLLIALMPMSVYISSSVSADSLNLALSFFTISLFLNLAFKKNKIQGKDILLVSLSILGLALSKQIYALLGLLFFIIPKSKFNNLKIRLTYFIIMILPSGILLLLWQYEFILGIINSLIVGTNHYFDFSSVDSSQSTTPFFIRLINSILINFNGYLSSFVGTYGWATHPLPLSLAYLYLFTLAFISLLKGNKFIFSLKQKLIPFLIFSIGTTLIFFIASFWNSPSRMPQIIKYQIIGGVQGRYFIPFAPLFFLILQNKKITNYLDKKKSLFKRIFKYFYYYFYSNNVIYINIFFVYSTLPNFLPIPHIIKS